jgi:aldose 1-epimerase
MRETVVTQQSWLTKSGDQAEPNLSIYRIESSKIKVKLTNYGARLVDIEVPDRRGIYGDVLLGYEVPELYLADKRTHLGATVGRYANRIADGTFYLNGKKFYTDQNRGRITLHGGSHGFDKLVWLSSIIESGVQFSLLSPDGDMGFPGNLQVGVRFTVDDDALRVDYSAETDQDTVVNLSNHAYFNLGGSTCESIEDHLLELAADEYTPINSIMIPTGEILPVNKTPFDFRKLTRIGEHINSSDPQIEIAKGYDHNFVLKNKRGSLERAAFVFDPISGRTMTVYSTEPGIQFYSGNMLDGTFIGRHGMPYSRRCAMCLETQHFPDSPNQPHFPTTKLTRGGNFRSTTVYRFAFE